MYRPAGDIELFKVHKGQATSLDSDTYTTAASVTVKVKLDGTTIQAWVDDTLEIDTTDSTHAAGGVAFAGVQPKFDDLYVFHDINTNGSYDAGTDELFRNEDFGSTSTTFSHDDAGNLVDDGTFVYVYDAWHRLVKAQASADSDVTVGTYAYDALGRRIKKVVTDSGDLDGTEL